MVPLFCPWSRIWSRTRPTTYSAVVESRRTFWYRPYEHIRVVVVDATFRGPRLTKSSPHLHIALLQEPTHASAVWYRTHGMSCEPIARMMSMKPVGTVHTEDHELTFQVLTFQSLRSARLCWIRATKPHHTDSTAWHLGATIRACQSGRDCTVFACRCAWRLLRSC